MPVDFLTQKQQESYGRYAGEPSPEQLARYFHLDDADRALLKKRRGNHNRLVFAVQLGTVRFLGTFLPDPTNVPPEVVAYVSDQLGIADPTCLRQYMDRPATHREHAGEIQRHYGYRDFNDQPGHFGLVRWLYTRAWFSAERPSVLFDLATARLVQHKILLPGVTTLTRLMAQVRDRTANRLWHILAGIPDQQQRERLEALLTVPDGEQNSHMDRLRRGPTRASSLSLINALDRLEEFRAVGAGRLKLNRVPSGRLKVLARYAATASSPRIARMPEHRRIATLLAFAHTFEITAMDDALDVLDLLITDILAEAKCTGQKERLRTIRDLDSAALTLRAACDVLLDVTCEDAKVRTTTFGRISKERLAEAVTTVGALARPADDDYHKELVNQYGRVRRFLPALLRSVTFQGTRAAEPVLSALRFLADIEGQRNPDMSKAPLEVVSRGWRRLAIDAESQVNRHAYTLCVLQTLQDGLRRRDVFVSLSDRWGDPRAKMIQGNEWESTKPKVCRSLGRQQTAAGEIESLKRGLDDAYRRTDENFPANAAVRIENENGRDTVVLTALDKLDEPHSLIELRQNVQTLLPHVDLPEALLEIHARTGFLDEFTHVSEGAARVADLPVSLSAVLVAEACNIGLEAVVDPSVSALTRNRLSWVQQNYVRAETLTAGNARLVDVQAGIPLAQEWGGGEVASADGLRFVVPVRTVNAGPNPKYFGQRRGITYYNFTSDQFTGFHGIVIPGTLRDSMFLLDGLLEQQTSLCPVEVMTDTAGVSDVVFGLFWLLGYQFSPRMADIGGSTFWRIDPKADYGALNDVSRNRVNTKRIAEHWDDMLRIAASLRMGMVSASELIRTLLKSHRPSALARAIAELGRVPKTIHQLNYLDDKTYRRRILTQLNRGESRNGISREVCYGKRSGCRNGL